MKSLLGFVSLFLTSEVTLLSVRLPSSSQTQQVKVLSVLPPFTPPEAVSLLHVSSSATPSLLGQPGPEAYFKWFPFMRHLLLVMKFGLRFFKF